MIDLGKGKWNKMIEENSNDKSKRVLMMQDLVIYRNPQYSDNEDCLKMLVREINVEIGFLMI